MQYPQLCSNTPTTYPHFVFIFSIEFIWDSINSHCIAEFCCLYKINALNKTQITEYGNSFLRVSLLIYKQL